MTNIIKDKINKMAYGYVFNARNYAVRRYTSIEKNDERNRS
jgi:hypothetical protein